MRRSLLLLACALLVSGPVSSPAWAGTNKAAPVASSLPAAHAQAPANNSTDAADPKEPDETHPQAELPKEPLVFVTHDGQHHLFHVEMAQTMDQQTVGLMLRRSVPADGGMLFDWGYPRESDMWMKNTLVSLDMVFIDQNGIIRHIAENTVPQSLAVISSGGQVRAALELAAGTAERLNLQVGDHVEQRIFAKASP